MAAKLLIILWNLNGDTSESVSSAQIYDVAVIGAGIAGLTAAALLQHDGARVLLLEKHDKVGGCAGYFDVDDKELGRFSFDAGATVALGFDERGLHRRVFERLGIREAESTLMDGLRVVLPDREVFIAHDRKRWRREREGIPGNRRGQRTFWVLQELVADAGWRALERLPSLPLQTSRDWLRGLKLAHPGLLPLAPFLHSTTGDVLARMGLEHEREFRALLDLGLIITVQEEAARAPFVNACAGLDLWRHGAWHLRGGMGEIGRLLLAAFQRDGGTVRLGATVERIAKQPDGLFMVTTRGNHEALCARRVVANVPLQNIEALIDLPERPREKVRSMVTRLAEGWGAVTLYGALREDAIPAGAPLHQQILLDYEAKAGDGRDVFLSFSSPGDTSQAPVGWRTLTASTHTRLPDWQGMSPEEYRMKKREWREKLLAGVRRALPAFEENRKFVLAGTPCTWESYTGRAAGLVGGIPLTLATAGLNSLPQRLGLRHFWVVGDTTFPGQGTIACTLSGINAWRDITGAHDL